MTSSCRGRRILVYIGILVYLILPAIFVLGLALIPLGIWLKKRSLRRVGKLPEVFPAIDPPFAHRAPNPRVRSLGHGIHSPHHWDGIVPRSAVHGYSEFLRDNLSCRNAA
jgi:hypothetical protein